MSNISEEARLAAASKKASDYEAPKDAEDKRSADEIQKDIERVRDEMTATVNELAARLDPKTLANDAKQTAKVKLDESKAKAQALANDAAAGDTKSIAIIGGVALGVAAIIARKIFK